MNGVDRVPPQNLEFEMALIGAVFGDSELASVARASVRAEDFYAANHETIFAAIERLDDDRLPIDKLAVAEELRRTGFLERVGGVAYLSRLTVLVPTIESATYYAAVIAEKAALRRLIDAGNAIVRAAYDGETDVDAAISESERVLGTAIAHDGTASGVTLGAAAGSAFTDLSAICSGESPNRAILTPWPRVNDLVGGFFPSELVVIAAAPAQGKTGLVISLADYIAEVHGNVAFFTLEMPQRAITQRWLALYSEVSARTQRLGKIRDKDWERLSDAIARASRSRVHLFDRQSASSVSQIERATAKLARSTPVSAIVVDHVNFLADADVGKRDSATKHERLDRAYRRLLTLASDLGTVVFAVQHLNRAGMGMRPKMKDIRDGGNPEGHAHAVLMPYRPDAESAEWRERMKGELIVAKSRDGEEGSVPMQFHGWRHLWLEDGQDRAWFEAERARAGDAAVMELV